MFEDGEEKKKCKGVKKSVVKKTITHDDYKDCLFTKRELYRRMNVFRSYHHDIYTEEVNKVALSGEDDKRVIMDDGIHTLAHGHYKTKATEATKAATKATKRIG
jgi:transposase